MHRPEVHDVLRRWRRVADAYRPARVLVGETWAVDLAGLGAYYGAERDELHLAFNFAFSMSEFEPHTLRAVVDETERELHGRGWPVWTASNHDIGRLATRWCGGDERRIRVALMLLLTLRGTPFLYAGDEIGLPDAILSRGQLRDPVGIRSWPTDPGRDRCRTPMPWRPGDGAGFTSPQADPWLPIVTPAGGTVAEQREDPDSNLSFVRGLLALRRARPDLSRGGYTPLVSPPGTWLFGRGASTAVALSFDEATARVACPPGTVLAATDRALVGSRVADRLELPAWQGIVVATGVTGDTVHD
jgi:alpha-glucosidase